jgi:DNA-binding CsgD family transcriptional regulator
MAARLDTPEDGGYQRRIEQADTEIDNLRAAFAWSRERSDTELALTLAAALQPLWLARGRIQEGLNWLSAALADADLGADDKSAARVRASVGRTVLLSFSGMAFDLDDPEQILAAAREHGDPTLVARALTACGCFADADRELGGACFAEAAAIARDIGDSWWLGQTLVLEAIFALIFAEPDAAEVAAEDGLRIADGIGDDLVSRQCRYVLGWSQILRGDIAGGLARLRELDEESTAARDFIFVSVPVLQSCALAYQGDTDASRTAAERALARASDFFDWARASVHQAFAFGHLATGDAEAAWEAFEAGRELTGMYPQTAPLYNWAALAPLARGDLAMARRWADDVVSATTAWSLAAALTSRSRVEIAQGELDAADRDAYDALELAASLGGDLVVPFALDCLASVAADTGNQLLAARLFGASDAARQHMGMVRFKVFDEVDESTIAVVREALGENDFEAAWAEGAALSIEEATAYALRGRGERKRATSGWGSLTRAELDVVKHVAEGLGNKEVAARLFVSPRTVQAHLTHIYTKLGLTSRVQLAQEAARHV